MSCVLVGYRHLFWRMLLDSKKMDMPCVVARTTKWVRLLGYERVHLHGD